jgi:hypothetical protein
MMVVGGIACQALGIEKEGGEMKMKKDKAHDGAGRIKEKCLSHSFLA